MPAPSASPPTADLPDSKFLGFIDLTVEDSVLDLT